MYFYNVYFLLQNEEIRYYVNVFYEDFDWNRYVFEYNLNENIMVINLGFWDSG